MPLSQSQIALLWTLVITLIVGVMVAFFAVAWMDEADPVGVVGSGQPWNARQIQDFDLPLENFSPDKRLDVDAAEAERRNLAIPLAGADNPLAPRFNAAWLGANLEASINCLAAAVYYESAGEPVYGQRAVAQVVLNRVRNPHYPKTVCEVVYQGSERKTGCQFTFTCDGSLARKPSASGWSLALAIATSALHGVVSREAGQATHYHALSVLPVWASSLLKIAMIGHHVFYRPPGRGNNYPVFAQALVADPVAMPTVLPVVPPVIMIDKQILGNGETIEQPVAGSGSGSAMASPVPAAPVAQVAAPASSPTPDTNFPVVRKRAAPLPLSSVN